MASGMRSSSVSGSEMEASHSLCMIRLLSSRISNLNGPLFLTSTTLDVQEKENPYTVLSLSTPPEDLNSEVIYVDGSPVEINRETAEAIRNISPLPTPYFWVESLCLPEDSKSRTSAAFSHRTILRHAAEVIVPVELSRCLRGRICHVITSLPLLMSNPRAPLESQMIMNLYKTWDHPAHPYAYQFRDFKSRLACQPGIDLEELRRMWLNFLEAPAFKMGYTIQDMIIGRSVSIQCGQYRVTLQQVCMAASAVYQILTAQLGALKQKIQWERLAPIRKAIVELQLRHDVWAMYQHPKHRKQLTFLHILSRFGTYGRFNCPKDVVFRLLAVSSDTSRLQREISYDQTVQRLYTVVAGILFRHSDFRVLEFVQWPKSILSLPTWVPDFSAIRYPSIDSITSHNRINYRLGPEAGIPSDKATNPEVVGSNKPSLHLFKEGFAAITLSGVVIDSVYNTGYSASQPQPDRKPDYVKVCYALSDLKNFCEESRDLQRQPGTFQIHKDATEQDASICRICLLATPGVQGGEISTDQVNMMGTRFLEAMRMHWEVYSVLRGDIKISDLDLPQEIYDACQALSEDQRNAYLAMVLAHCHWTPSQETTEDLGRGFFGRRPIITNKGFVGLAPIDTHKNDLVFVPRGANVPIIVRPVNLEAASHTGLHTLIGEAYIDGMMSGRAWEMDIAERIITLA